MANMMTYCSGWLRQSRMPKMPVTPVPLAPPALLLIQLLRITTFFALTVTPPLTL